MVEKGLQILDRPTPRQYDQRCRRPLQPGQGRANIRKEHPVFARLFSSRKFVAAWILGLVLSLIPFATVLADGGGTWYPH